MRVRWFYAPRMAYWYTFRLKPFWSRGQAIGLWGRIGWRYWSLAIAIRGEAVTNEQMWVAAIFIGYPITVALWGMLLAMLDERKRR